MPLIVALYSSEKSLEDEIKQAAQQLKDDIRSQSQEDAISHFEKQKEQYDSEYNSFLEHYEKDECYLCERPLSTISKNKPCLHWLLRKCKFRKKDFSKVTDNYDYYNISSYLRWVANVETGSRDINNLKEESSERKIFEITIRWNNIEWTLDCSKNDFSGHGNSKTDFPHWHFQMRIDGKQFINFSDFHIPLSKNDQLKIVMENDPSSGFHHTFGPGGLGMQEHMDSMEENPDSFLENAIATSDPEEGAFHMQTIVKGAEGGISGEKINEAMEMSKATGKTISYCLQQVLSDDPDVSILTVTRPAESVPEIAKRSERKRR